MTAFGRSAFVFGSLSSVVGHIPTGALELYCGRRNKLAHCTITLRTAGNERIGKSLYLFKAMGAAFALVFVERHQHLPETGAGSAQEIESDRDSGS